jgi:hypothetical protein
MKIQHSPNQNPPNMTALLPHPSLLRIGQAAKATGCTPKALRLYEARGLIPPAIRQGQYRYYHAEHLRFIDVIKLAQRAGFRLSELIGCSASNNSRVIFLYRPSNRRLPISLPNSTNRSKLYNNSNRSCWGCVRCANSYLRSLWCVSSHSSCNRGLTLPYRANIRL